MKKILLFLLGVLIALPGMAYFTYEYEGQTLKYTVLDETAKTCKIEWNNSVSGNLIIPSIAKNGDTEYTVTSIRGDAFYKCSGLTSVTIPGSVTSIGDDAFYGCASVKRLIIEDGEKTLSLGYNSYGSDFKGEGLFYNCPLETVYLGRNLSYNAYSSHGYSPFYGNSSLKTLTIGNSVTTIGYYAFAWCSGLTEVIIGNSVNSIGTDAFKNCSGLKKSAYPNTLSNPFPSGVCVAYNPSGAIIEDNWIYGPEKAEIRFAPYTLEGEYSIPESVTSIGIDALNGCSGLTSVIIGNSVTSIGESTFRSCSGLTSVTIGNSVSSIGSSAFEDCSGLTSVIIGNLVTSIGGSAFSGCSGLTKADFASIEALCKISFGNDSANPLYYAHNLYINGEEVKEVVIPESINSIKNYTFDGCSGLTSVTIPNSVTSIDTSAFSGCSGLTKADFASIEALCKIDFGNGSANPLYYAHNLYINGEEVNDVVIPEYVTSIKEYTFSGCSGLTSVAIPSSVTSIGDAAFNGCSSIKELKIEDGEETLSLGFNTYSYYGPGGGLFNDCPLETLYLGRNLSYDASSSYGYSPFYGKSSLKTLTIGNSVTSIGSYAFSDCSGLTEVIIPGSVTSIGSSAFSGCSGLKKSAYPNTLSNPFPSGVCVAYNPSGAIIEDNWIYGPEKAEIRFAPYTLEGEYSIPGSVNSIGKNAFYGCSGLTSVTIPNSVTSIGNNAFKDCSGLTKADFASIEALCKISFDNDLANPLYYAHNLYINGEEVKEVVIPETVNSIGKYAFESCSGLTSVIIPNSVTSIGDAAFQDCI